MPGDSAAVAALITAGCLLLALIWVLGIHRARHLAASNTRVAASGVSLTLAPGATRCQGGEYVPSRASRARLFVGPPPGRSAGPLTLTFEATDGGPGFIATAPATARSGALLVELPRPRPTLELARLCIANDGATAIGLAGNFTSANPAAPPQTNGPGERRGDEVRVDYYLADHPSWLSLAPAVVERASLFRSRVVTPVTIWLVLAGLLVVVGGAAVFAVRGLRSLA